MHFALAAGAGKGVEVLAAEDLRQRGGGEQEPAARRREPALLVGAQCAIGDDAVHMHMVSQVLPPGVQHHGDAEFPAQPPGVASELKQGARSGVEQQPVDRHRVAVLASLALVDPQEHAPGIDIGHAQARQFAAPKPGGVGGHQQGTALGVGRHREQPQQFVMIEDLGQGGRCLGAGQIEVRFGQPERDPVEKPDAVAYAVAALPGQPPLFVKVDEVVLDLLGRDAVGTAPVMTR